MYWAAILILQLIMIHSSFTNIFLEQFWDQSICPSAQRSACDIKETIRNCLPLEWCSQTANSISTGEISSTLFCTHSVLINDLANELTIWNIGTAGRKQPNREKRFFCNLGNNWTADLQHLCFILKHYPTLIQLQFLFINLSQTEREREHIINLLLHLMILDCILPCTNSILHWENEPKFSNVGSLPPVPPTRLIPLHLK